MRIALLLLSLFSSACVPVVQHGPWVRRGVSGSVGGSFAAVGEGGETGAAPMISFEGGMRLGFTSNDSTRHGASLGLQVPLIALLAIDDAEDSFGSNFLQLIHIDGFVALPATKSLDASLGISRSSFHTMPYVQLGKYDRWYTTQAFMLADESNSWLWAPSFSWVRPNGGGSRTHLTATAGVGSDDDEVYWMAGFSIIFEIARARN